LPSPRRGNDGDFSYLFILKFRFDPMLCCNLDKRKFWRGSLLMVKWAACSPALRLNEKPLTDTKKSCSIVVVNKLSCASVWPILNLRRIGSSRHSPRCHDSIPLSHFCTTYSAVVFIAAHVQRHVYGCLPFQHASMFSCNSLFSSGLLLKSWKFCWKKLWRFRGDVVCVPPQSRMLSLTTKVFCRAMAEDIAACRAFLSRCIDCCFRVSQVVLPVVGSVSPEGHLPDVTKNELDDAWNQLPALLRPLVLDAQQAGDEPWSSTLVSKSQWRVCFGLRAFGSMCKIWRVIISDTGLDGLLIKRLRGRCFKGSVRGMPMCWYSNPACGCLGVCGILREANVDIFYPRPFAECLVPKRAPPIDCYLNQHLDYWHFPFSAVLTAPWITEVIFSLCSQGGAPLFADGFTHYRAINCWVRWQIECAAHIYYSVRTSGAARALALNQSQFGLHLH